MPRYFFDIYDGFHRPDSDGTDLSGADEAQVEAVILAGHLLKDHAAEVLRCDDWHLSVTDVTGAMLFRLVLYVTATPLA